MAVKLKFLGGARNVTGSRHVLEIDDVRIMVDCGLYQERDLRDRNWDPCPVDPGSIDAVLLTHAHLDHIGWLPKLVKDGFRGKVYCTAATAELSEIVLFDSAHLQKEDAEFKKKRHKREGREGKFPVEPLYLAEHVEDAIKLFVPCDYESPIQIKQGIEAYFYDAGHILGAAMIKIHINRNGKKCTVLFSGDIGRVNRPIIEDPTFFDEADYVVMESTYGDRIHEDKDNSREMLMKVINETVAAGGNIVVPSFSIERSQDLLYYINELIHKDKIPHLLVFLDSPMAIKATKIFMEHPELYDSEMLEHVNNHQSPFAFTGLQMTSTPDQSKAINRITGTVMVIAGSGMCTGGRIKHHLVNNISRPESAILFAGYQAVGTLGRQIVDGKEEVRILGKTYPVRAKIYRMHGFSGHADQEELLHWVTRLKKAPKKVFIVHGEPEATSAFSQLVKKKTGWDTLAPSYKDQVLLDCRCQE